MVAVSVAVNIDMMVIPIRIHNTANTLPAADLGHLSPYLERFSYRIVG